MEQNDSPRRARILLNSALLEKHRDELAALIVSEHGKVWSDALGELTRHRGCREFCLWDPAPQQKRVP